MNFWNLYQFWKRSYSILGKIICDPTGSYSILENPIRSYRILWDGYTYIHTYPLLMLEIYRVAVELKYSRK